MLHQNNKRRVVVSGLGALTPIGLSVDNFWNAMMQGRSGAAPITLFDASGFQTRFACELKNFDPLNYVDRKQVRRLDPFSQYALGAVAEMAEDSCMKFSTLTREERSRIGVIFGTGIGGLRIFQDQVAHFARGERLSPLFIPMMITNIASGNICIQYGLHGPSYCAVSACATGNHNIGDAFMQIRLGYMDAAISGGTEAPISQIGIAGFNAMRALSTRNDDPARACRPCDATRDGFVMGEGAGALFLEDLEHALDRGARIYAELIGYGMSSDANHLTAPDVGGIQLALEMALKDAGIAPADVDYINLHSTSTPLGDAAETQAIKAVFGESAYDVNLSSTKSMIGHLLGAAGAVEAIAAIKAIEHNRIPPTINFEHADPECDLNYTFNEPVDREVNIAMSNAFGFGGHNTSLVFKRFEE